MSENQISLRQRFEGLATTVINDKCAEFLDKPEQRKRMLRVALAAAAKNPKIFECAPQTVALALMHCAELRLEPSSVLGHAYLIPRYSKQLRGQECTFLIGYKGYLELARRSGEIASMVAQVVYDGEGFSVTIEDGEARIRHDIAFGKGAARRDEDIIASYCIVKMKDGSVYADWCDRTEIDERRKAGGDRSFSPWSTHYARMARKSAIRKLLAGGMVPLSAEMLRAHEIETEIEAAIATEVRASRGTDLLLAELPDHSDIDFEGELFGQEEHADASEALDD